MELFKGKTVVMHLAFSLLFLLFIGMPATGMAHEAEHDHGNQEMSPHMQAMLKAKALIPREYKLMDRTPVTPDTQSLARGKAVYQEKCVVCHGEKGNGQGPAAAGLKTPPANFLDLDHSANYGPGEKYWLIGNGNDATGMPGFPQLSPADRWHLVNYILSLQKIEKAVKPHHEH